MTINQNFILRRVRFKTWTGARFTLTTWDTNRTIHGKYCLGYRLNMNGKTLFEGEDFGCAPSHAVDSDAAVEGIMSFLTLRPGDTDKEYFEDYTPAQLEFCSQHAEALKCEVMDWFGEDN